MDIVLGLDIGDSRTGIAQSDPMGIFIKPLKTIPSTTLIKELGEFTESYEEIKLIVGLPKDKDGTEREQAQKTRKTCQEIQKYYPKIQIIFEDERFTSKEAEQIIKDKGIRIGKDNKGLIDSYSAAILLEQFFQKSI